MPLLAHIAARRQMSGCMNGEGLLLAGLPGLVFVCLVLLLLLGCLVLACLVLILLLLLGCIHFLVFGLLVRLVRVGLLGGVQFLLQVLVVVRTPLGVSRAPCGTSSLSDEEGVLPLGKPAQTFRCIFSYWPERGRCWVTQSSMGDLLAGPSCPQSL